MTTCCYHSDADPLSFLAAIRNMIAGFEVTSMWALVSCPCDTTHWDDGPQYTRANAIVPSNSNHGNDYGHHDKGIMELSPNVANNSLP